MTYRFFKTKLASVISFSVLTTLLVLLVPLAAFSLEPEVLEAVKAVAQGKFTPKQEALVVLHNKSINLEAVGGRLPDDLYQPSQGVFERVNNAVVEASAKEAGLVPKTQAAKPGVPKAANPGKDTDIIVQKKPGGPDITEAQIRAMEDAYQKNLSDYLKRQGVKVPPGKINTETDFMPHPDHTSAAEFRKINEGINQRGGTAYESPDAARVEAKLRPRPGEEIPELGIKETSAYAQEMQKLANDKLKSAAELEARANSFRKTDPGRAQDFDADAQLLRSQASKYTDRIDKVVDTLNEQKGLPERLKSKDSLTRAGSDIRTKGRGPQTKAEADFFGDTGKLAVDRAVKDFSETLSKIAAKNPESTALAQRHIVDQIKGMNSGMQDLYVKRATEAYTRTGGLYPDEFEKGLRRQLRQSGDLPKGKTVVPDGPDGPKAKIDGPDGPKVTPDADASGKWNKAKLGLGVVMLIAEIGRACEVLERYVDGEISGTEAVKLVADDILIQGVLGSATAVKEAVTESKENYKEAQIAIKDANKQNLVAYFTQWEIQLRKAGVDVEEVRRLVAYAMLSGDESYLEAEASRLRAQGKEIAAPKLEVVTFDFDGVDYAVQVGSGTWGVIKGVGAGIYTGLRYIVMAPSRTVEAWAQGQLAEAELEYQSASQIAWVKPSLYQRLIKAGIPAREALKALDGYFDGTVGTETLRRMLRAKAELIAGRLALDQKDLEQVMLNMKKMGLYDSDAKDFLNCLCRGCGGSLGGFYNPGFRGEYGHGPCQCNGPLTIWNTPLPVKDMDAQRECFNTVAKMRYNEAQAIFDKWRKQAIEENAKSVEKELKLIKTGIANGTLRDEQGTLKMVNEFAAIKELLRPEDVDGAQAMLGPSLTNFAEAQVRKGNVDRGIDYLDRALNKLGSRNLGNEEGFRKSRKAQFEKWATAWKEAKEKHFSLIDDLVRKKRIRQARSEIGNLEYKMLKIHTLPPATEDPAFVALKERVERVNQEYPKAALAMQDKIKAAGLDHKSLIDPLQKYLDEWEHTPENRTQWEKRLASYKDMVERAGQEKTLGEEREKAGDLPGAIAAYGRSLGLQKDDGLARRLDELKKQYQIQTEKAEKARLIWIQARRLTDEKKYPEAISKYKEGLALSPNKTAESELATVEWLLKQQKEREAAAAKKAEEAKKAEAEKKAAEAKRAEEAKKAETEKKAAEAQKAEEAKRGKAEKKTTSGNVRIILSADVFDAGQPIEVLLEDLPATKNNWVTLVPQGLPDTEYKEWSYTGDKSSFRYVFAGQDPGTYEVRVYYNWPTGKYVVQKRKVLTVRSKTESEKKTAVSGAKYLGCFKDTGARDLSGYNFQSGQMSTDMCLQTCRDKGFGYAGTQYSSWCFCGDTYGKYGPASNCDMKCSGKADETCGGTWANSIYLLAKTAVEQKKAQQAAEVQKAAPLGSAKQLEGSWEISANRFAGRIEFQTVGNALTGRLWLDAHGRWETLKDISYDGQTLRFLRPIPNLDQRYTGRGNDKEITGTFDQAGGGVFQWRMWRGEGDATASNATSSAQEGKVSDKKAEEAKRTTETQKATGSSSAVRSTPIAATPVKPVSASANGASLHLNASVVEPNAPFTVRWTAGPDLPGNAWLGLMPAATPHGKASVNGQHHVAHEFLQKKTSGEHTFTAPSKEGRYDVRISDPSKDQELVSATFTVQVNQAAGSLSLPRKTYAPNEPITVSFTASAGYPGNAWVGLIPSATPHGKASVNGQHHVAHEFLQKKTSGEMSFTAPTKEGNYDLRMSETTNDKEIASVTFTVAVPTGGIRLALPKSRYAPNEKITVAFSAPATLPGNAWVGLIPSATPHGKTSVNDQHDMAYVYLQKKTSGEMSFTAPTKEGNYDLRMSETTNDKEIASVTFTVAVPTGGIRLALPKSRYAPNEKITVAFSAPATLPGNAWVGLIPSATPHGKTSVNDQHDMAYVYLQKKTSGEMSFTAPTKEGTYDLRMCETTNDKEIASVTFTVAVPTDDVRLTLPKSRYAPNEKIIVTFIAPATLPDNAWVGLIPSATPHGKTSVNSQHKLYYANLNKKTSGELSFTAPTKEGTYDLRMCETTNDKEITSVTFTVAVPTEGIRLTLPKSKYAPNEKITVAFTAPATLPDNAWVGLIPSTTPHGKTSANSQHKLHYANLNKKTSGEMSFTAPAKEGNYDLRMSETTNDKELLSLSFQVVKDASSTGQPVTAATPPERPNPAVDSSSASGIQNSQSGGQGVTRVETLPEERGDTLSREDVGSGGKRWVNAADPNHFVQRMTTPQGVRWVEHGGGKPVFYFEEKEGSHAGGTVMLFDSSRGMSATLYPDRFEYGVGGRVSGTYRGGWK